mmetsp:Transcript_9583/g.14430  ORF Transcript_9583/g.14430 Transcript_9583/m.14430 type:complete len:389 (-) Transcript_9583:231-1397(-)|eukprot:CAMPEP_0185028266 /NCGR_PEP_ID=MMETSP1103-20130426/13931_1 /TAXON_ID=36769 /ORGANISM="Paraphysomonas bandaiensis, Strain Caron Lab Isolate" /LENGTH=388 /DNA_ID=CAMNT_0027562641 /DNA_START=88 /DNA_END=1254 /DNA_ORIENTATION=-
MEIETTSPATSSTPLRKERRKYSKVLIGVEKAINYFTRNDGTPLAVITCGAPAGSRYDFIGIKKRAWNAGGTAEAFLSKGYRVLFIHSCDELTPFTSGLRASIPPTGLVDKLSISGQRVVLNVGSYKSQISHGIRTHKEATERNCLLNVPFTSPEEFVHIVRFTCNSVVPLGGNLIWINGVDTSFLSLSRNSTTDGELQSLLSGAKVKDYVSICRSENCVEGMYVRVVEEGMGKSAQKGGVDMLMEVKMENNICTIALFNMHDPTSALKITPKDASSTLSGVEAAACGLLIGKHVETYNASTPNESFVSSLAAKYLIGEYSEPDTHNFQKPGPSRLMSASSIQIISRQITALGGDEPVSSKLCISLCFFSVVFVVGMFALITILLRDY